MRSVTDGMVEHMKKQAGPDSRLLNSEKDLEAFVNHFDPSVIGEQVGFKFNTVLLDSLF